MKYTKPKKADGALLNTWIVDVDGTSIEHGKGGSVLKKKTLSVRFTSEGHETISIANEQTGVQYIMNFKKIEELIERARAERKKS